MLLSRVQRVGNLITNRPKDNDGRVPAFNGKEKWTTYNFTVGGLQPFAYSPQEDPIRY